jgi:Lipocalin-like domain
MRRSKIYILLIFFNLILFSIIACHNQKPHQTMIRFSSLVGSWHLISRIDKTNSGTIINEPILGSDPIALLMYDSLGNMSVQIMKRNRNDSIATISPQQYSDNSAAFNGYDAYFGTYIIDTIKHQIKHHIKGTINQKDLGKELIRNYSISGDTLLLWFMTSNANATVTRTLTWVREK